MDVKTVSTKPRNDQKPGTGGIRARTRTFMEPNYLENFVQSVINVWKSRGYGFETFVIGGDGRYPGLEFLPKIIKILAANGIRKVMVVGRGLVATTPAVSHIIRKYGADGGFMLSASHNPGGIDGDFGIKTEMPNGGGAPEYFTGPLFEETKSISEYLTLNISDDEAMALPMIEYVDPVKDYADLMESMFDFALIRKWFATGHTMRFDAMNASTGPAAREIFVKRLGAPADSIVRGTPMPDFDGLHPEPNPHYNPDIVRFMVEEKGADFGAACDGDGDRNMILGRGILVYPPDSLAVMVKHHGLIPYYRNGLKGVARSLPSSSAVDLAAERIGAECYRTPTGWKFFATLLDAGMISLCGEESFGQGGDYIREKDAIFAILFWLNIMAATGETPAQILRGLWDENGRVFYSQYSYEGVDKAKAETLVEYIKGADLTGKKFGAFAIKSKENFRYVDPVDGSVSDNQGVQIFTENGVRIFFRLSGTGTVGATLRFYVEKYESDPSKFGLDLHEYMRDAYILVDEIFRIGDNFPDAKKTVAI
ncbi:MAG: alpha-D-glucose phosphate-specific phosphoglucomutase [Rickettsiales bacterium]|jgi:phosphoglucomutase|nr:alpha-D-glucose phosphate-specific phosphoglucomutase [Rickettsiales bacterium]